MQGIYLEWSNKEGSTHEAHTFLQIMYSLKL
jgi:hypothetical protein